MGCILPELEFRSQPSVSTPHPPSPKKYCLQNAPSWESYVCMCIHILSADSIVRTCLPDLLHRHLCMPYIQNWIRIQTNEPFYINVPMTYPFGLSPPVHLHLYLIQSSSHLFTMSHCNHTGSVLSCSYNILQWCSKKWALFEAEIIHMHCKKKPTAALHLIKVVHRNYKW